MKPLRHPLCHTALFRPAPSKRAIYRGRFIEIALYMMFQHFIIGRSDFKVTGNIVTASEPRNSSVSTDMIAATMRFLDFSNNAAHQFIANTANGFDLHL